MTGHIPDQIATHTASDIPLSAFGKWSLLFTGVMDNTDVFFKVAQGAVGDISFAVEHRGLFRSLWRNPGDRDQVPKHPHGQGGDGDDDWSSIVRLKPRPAWQHR